MALWVCTQCSCRYAVGAPCCPQCRGREWVPEHEEDGVAKISKAGVSYGPDLAPQEHPGTGVPMEGIEHPADGTEVTIGNKDDGVPGEQVTQLPPGEVATPEPLSPPPVSAPKADHVDYATTALGLPEDEAAAMTKPELVELARSAADGQEQEASAPATAPLVARPPVTPPRRTPPPSGG